VKENIKKIKNQKIKISKLIYRYKELILIKKAIKSIIKIVPNYPKEFLHNKILTIYILIKITTYKKKFFKK
jgi:hypothetical protein